jgi:hypothetical protein
MSTRRKPKDTTNSQACRITLLASPEHKPITNPYSRPLRRGALGDIDGRSTQGRFLRAVERDLLSQLGPAPTVSQQLLVRRIARNFLMLEALDSKLISGDWNDCDSRTQGGLNNSVRLGLVALGLKAAQPAPKMDLQTYLATKK